MGGGPQEDEPGFVYGTRTWRRPWSKSEQNQSYRRACRNLARSCCQTATNRFRVHPMSKGLAKQHDGLCLEDALDSIDVLERGD